VTSNILQSVRWAFHDAQGNALPGPPNFLTNVFVELYDISGFLVWSSSNLPPTTTFLDLTNVVKWPKVWRFNLDYYDTLGNLYIVSFYHSPQPPLEIVDALLPKGSLATPYRVQLVASNGVPPYVWSVSDGKLPAGVGGEDAARSLAAFAVRIDFVALGDLPLADHLLDGTDYSGASDEVRSAARNRKIGFVFQQFHLLDRAPAVRNVTLPLLYAENGGSDGVAKAERALAYWPLAKRRLPRRYAA
jgi:hypothetical protein